MNIKSSTEVIEVKIEKQKITKVTIELTPKELLQLRDVIGGSNINILSQKAVGGLNYSLSKECEFNDFLCSFFRGINCKADEINDENK